MSFWQKVQRNSHDPAFLWKVAGGIVAAGVLLGFAAPWLPSLAPSDPVDRCLYHALGGEDDHWQRVQDCLAGDDLTLYQAMHVVELLTEIRETEPPNDLADAFSKRSLPDQQQAVVRAFIASLHKGQPNKALHRLAATAPPTPFANYAAGLCWLSQDNLSDAIPRLIAAGKQPDSEYARQLLVKELGYEDQWSTLEKLSRQPEYDALLPSYVQAHLAAERGEWLTVLRLSPATLVNRFEIGPAILAALTGVCWMAFVVHIGSVLQPGGKPWLYVAALVLGVLSIPLTHFFIVYQDVAWGLHEAEDLTGGVKYFVLGVGLREELAKLLLLVPLLPWLVRGCSELRALLVSACVGLGFAITENMGYFGTGLNLGTVGRLVTASFAHMSLTGLVGLAVCRGAWHPKTSGPEALAVFSLAVIIHGLYDAFIAVPALAAEFSMVGMILYILLVYQFFRELHAALGNRHFKLNVSFTFTVGVALVASATYVYVSSIAGPETALKVLGPNLLGSAAMIYLFLRESPDSLIDR